MNKPCLFFLTPYLDRNGAENALLNLLQQLDQLNEFELVLISGFKGALFDKVPGKVKFYSLNDIVQRLKWKVKRRVLKADMRNRILESLHRKHKPILWFINSSVQPRFLQIAMKFNVPVIHYAHELGERLNQLDLDYLHDLHSYPGLTFVSSELVKQELMERGSKTSMEVLYPAINFASVQAKKDANKVRKEYGIDVDNILWISVGNIDENKNPKLFLEVAKRVQAQLPGARFLWIGGDLNSELGKQMVELIQEQGMDGFVQFSGSMERQQYLDLLSVADGILCTSGQESFGVVLMEAAYLGKPVVSTPCGGPVLTVKPEMGIITGSFGAGEIAEAVLAISKGDVEISPEVSRRNTETYSETSVFEKFIRLLREQVATITEGGRRD